MEKLVKIKNIYLTRLNNAQYLHFMIEVEKLVRTATLEKLQISEKLFQKFQENIKILTEKAYENRSEQQTKELMKLDKERDNIVRYLLTSIRNERKSHIVNRKEASESLYEATKNYKNVPTMEYNEESVAIRALLSDLASDKNAKDVATLGLTATLEHLKTLNEDFEKQMGDRTFVQSSKETGSTKKVRKETNLIYDEIALRAQSQSIAIPSVEASTFVAVLNKLIDDSLILSRSKQKPDTSE
ncbi:DUF6261 family protein [Capnocytophaga cynodegmi]|uniref:DUF6261 family protein n=1 Tax=Capnocytophaga cynodegmi TaxID=28189 RepID=UPI00385CBED2